MLTFTEPDTRKIDLSDGAWILVKKRLNAGDTKRIFSGVVRTLNLGEKIELDPEKVGAAKAVVYLLDWSASDRYPIRRKSPAEIEDALNALDPDPYKEVIEAIDKHHDEMDAERSAEKNAQDGEIELSKTLPSVA